MVNRKSHWEGATGGHRRTPIILLWCIIEEIIYREVQIDGIQESLLKSELPQLICLIMLLDVRIRRGQVSTWQSGLDAIERTELTIVVETPGSWMRTRLGELGIYTSATHMEIAKTEINNGAIYENFAAQELRAHGYNLYYFNNIRTIKMVIRLQFLGA